MEKPYTTLRYVSVGVVLCIILATVPTVLATSIDHTPEYAPEIKEHIRNRLQKPGNEDTVDWQPGQFLLIFLLVTGLYFDYLTNEGWFPGLTFAMFYLFVIFCILSLG